MPIGKWSTVTEAAQEIGVTRARIHQLIRAGGLGETRQFSTPRGMVWLIRRPLQRTSRPSGYHRAECQCGNHLGDGGKG